MKTRSRAHPFTSGSVALACIALALILPATLQVALLYALVVVIAIASGAAADVRRGFFAVLPIWVLLFILQVVLGADPRVSAPWGGTISQPGLDWALSQGIRLTVIATASLSFAALFNPHQFLQAAIAKRWPFSFAFLIVATLDAAARLGAQAGVLREAQRTRGVQVGGSLGTRFRALPALLFPLLLTSLTEADERALALETRGLMIAGPRTAIDPPNDTALDHATRWLSLALVIAAGIWRVRQ